MLANENATSTSSAADSRTVQIKDTVGSLREENLHETKCPILALLSTIAQVLRQ